MLSARFVASPGSGSSAGFGQHDIDLAARAGADVALAAVEQALLIGPVLITACIDREMSTIVIGWLLYGMTFAVCSTS